MLTGEGFAATDMGEPNNLEHSSWKAQAIRRGDLKISGPIPITEDMPLNEQEEIEFAETGALLSPGQPHGELDVEKNQPQTPSHPEHAPLEVPHEPAHQEAHHAEQPLLQPEAVPQRQPSRSPLRMHQVTEMPEDSVAQSVLYSPRPTTPLRSTPEDANKTAQKRKRKSGIRNVLRKMFGRKNKEEMEDEETSRRGHSYHHSDPGMLGASPPRKPTTPTGPRISELPVEDMEPLHYQHLPFPMNVNAPQASPPKEYLTFDMQRPDIGRRRATLPSVPSAGSQRHSFEEPRGRLSTWEERPSEEGASPGIGIALSSPTHSANIKSKRRSRSADALRELVRDNASTDRRRSAEIRYWRQSHASGSMYSRPQTAKTVETIRSVQAQEPTITRPGDGIVEMSATLVHASELTPSPLPTPDHSVPREFERDAQASVSAFNFGLKNRVSDSHTSPSEPLVPMSPPLPERNSQRLSMEDRVSILESTFGSLEKSLHRLSSRGNRQTIVLSDAPRNLRSRNRDSSSQSTSTEPIREPNQHPSNDTLKSNPASPPLVRPNSSSGNAEVVVEKLYEALKYEREARKALEQQVHNLTHDIADLHALVNKLIASATATSPSYPTPSPDTMITSTEERLLTPRPTEFTNIDGPESRFQCTNGSKSRDMYAGSEETSWKGSLGDDLASPDVWATPKEEVFQASSVGSGFFGERSASRGDLRGY